MILLVCTDGEEMEECNDSALCIEGEQVEECDVTACVC